MYIEIQSYENMEIQNIKNEEELNALLKAQPKLIDTIGVNGESLLLQLLYQQKIDLAKSVAAKKKHWNLFEAAAAGQLKELKVILDKNPNLINNLANDGFCALSLAGFFGHFEVAKELVERDADVNLMANNDSKIYPIHAATAASNLNILRLLLSNGADVNAAQHGGFCAIHSAASHGNLDMLKLLLHFFADINVKTDKGMTPLSFSLENGHSEASLILKLYGAYA
jgi:ankyrin repeat protein